MISVTVNVAGEADVTAGTDINNMEVDNNVGLPVNSATMNTGEAGVTAGTDINSMDADGYSSVDPFVDPVLRGGTQVKYTCLDLGPGFESFFPRLQTMLVRSEYPTMLKHIEEQSRLGISGAVVTGQPGIGKDKCYGPGVALTP